ncbi:IPT/TIG domain-containing protein [Archangium lipolyticum]|uniref:IPT/TIG domain-containing protein n=1 Tax=Archangium lipolyticum TaxID=2970465 RepID=UPI00214A1F30|nr:IPT/TIG domain-containing protein [Archangium lipolyticum]
MLIHLLSDYIRNPDVRRQFSDNPDELCAKYGIPPESLKQLQSGNVAGMLKHLAEELSNHALLGQGRRVFFWGGADITVTGVSPDTGKVNTRVHVTISGTNFPTDAEVTLQKPGVTLQAKSVKSVSTTELEAIVMASEAGSYDVVVKNPTTGTSGTKSQGFTATA